jgi:hypothetical protein
MLQIGAIVLCNRCDAATARFERGWFAYITAESDAETCVTVLCPACAGRNIGEGEAARSDWSRARTPFCPSPGLRPQRPKRPAGSATALLCAYLPVLAFAFWAALHLLHVAIATVSPFSP